MQIAYNIRSLRRKSWFEGGYHPAVSLPQGRGLFRLESADRRPSHFACLVDKARDAQNQRLLKSRRHDLHADRKPILRQACRCAHGGQTDQRDEVGGRDPVDVILEALAIDQVGEILLHRKRFYRRRRREQNIVSLEQPAEAMKYLLPRALGRGKVERI